MPSRLAPPALLLGAMLSLAGCIVATGPGPAPTANVNPYPAVPPGRYEVVPAAPGPASVWVWAPGHWEWQGRAYVWVAGSYVRRQPAWSHWVAGHWAFAGGVWRWVPGHWA